MRRDIDEALNGWSFDPSPGEVQAREVRARDGRTLLQVRVELGLLQLEVEGRPDGQRPHGFATYLDYLRYRAAERAEAPRAKAGPWSMSPEQCAEADREFVQYYHRRVAWLSLQRFERALMDADQTLALMDFVCRHGPSAEYIDSHERYRGFVLFHRAQAAAALALERRRPEEAVDAVRDGIDRLETHRRRLDEEPEPDEEPDSTLIEQLRQIEGEIRKSFTVGKTLREQLDEAVEREDYERAARLRDQLRSRSRR